MSTFFQKLANSLKIEDKEPEIITRPSRISLKHKPIPKINLEENRQESDDPPTKLELEKRVSEPSSETEGQLALDVYQTGSEFIIKSTIAGVKPEDLDIEITNDMVTVRGKRAKEEEIKLGDYFYQECYWGAFSRSVILPKEVDSERAEASLKNGVLTIRMPKLEKTTSRKLKVKETS